MVQKPVLKNVKKRTGQREVRPVWNNKIRINHQNFSNSKRNFAPTAVLTKSRIIPISTARQSSSRAAAPVSAARPINTVAPKLLNTAKGNKATSVIGEQEINAVKSLACWVWRSKIKGDPQDALKDHGLRGEKSDDNTTFHQIVDFLSSCLINYALTVSSTIYASYIKQFWNTISSKTINSVRQIHAIVDGKAIVIPESSVRSDLLFDDEDGITCLTNDEIFENLTLMGYEHL
nr:hypothetical protein [Tanacetum cinerariifolium]GFA18799.1 hypothetical protein [Tanacetum cinerariifolium]